MQLYTVAVLQEIWGGMDGAEKVLSAGIVIATDEDAAKADAVAQVRLATQRARPRMVETSVITAVGLCQLTDKELGMLGLKRIEEAG